ncbi:MAG: hypothetical protein OEZ58_14830 [Gammaproteobacteria bacterium]|nr:hypothetical protein [Gammaproteobacteria bacterium]MDH5730269.1 hypothetical protein [Gammaproteobacteria bacterium]
MYRISFLVSVLMMSISFSLLPKQADATAAFARSTGASCNKCHTASFPRLTMKGERFMRNGFQMRKQADDLAFGLDDEALKDSDEIVKKVSEILSVTGGTELMSSNSDDAYPALIAQKDISLLATTSVSKDFAVWAGVEINDETVELHRFFISRTNFFDSTWFNARAGSLDPTTWTSFYGHGAALDSASSGIGAYGGGHHGGGSGFTPVGIGFDEQNGIEYYGYNKALFWSVGLSNGSSAHGDDHGDLQAHSSLPANEAHGVTTETHHATGADKLDYWVVGRFDFLKDSSMSLLWYNANGSQELQMYSLAANLRFKKLDLRGQVSLDNTGNDDRYSRMGITMQADYAIAKTLAGILRFDTTDHGVGSDSVETQVTAAWIYKPVQNIKVTFAYVAELMAAAEPSADGHAHGHAGETAISGFGSHATARIRFMF